MRMSRVTPSKASISASARRTARGLSSSVLLGTPSSSTNPLSSSRRTCALCLKAIFSPTWRKSNQQLPAAHRAELACHRAHAAEEAGYEDDLLALREHHAAGGGGGAQAHLGWLGRRVASARLLDRSRVALDEAVDRRREAGGVRGLLTGVDKARQLVLHVSRGLEAVGWVERERAVEHLLERRGAFGIDRPWPRYQRLAHRLEGAAALEVTEERPAQGELEQDDAEREDVAAPVDALALGLFGRHVRELALDRPLLLDRVSRAGDAEVDDAHRAVEGEQHVLGADVAVDDLQRGAELVGLSVCVVEAHARLLADIGGEAVG